VLKGDSETAAGRRGRIAIHQAEDPALLPGTLAAVALR